MMNAANVFFFLALNKLTYSNQLDQRHSEVVLIGHVRVRVLLVEAGHGEAEQRQQRQYGEAEIDLQQARQLRPALYLQQHGKDKECETICDSHNNNKKNHNQSTTGMKTCASLPGTAAPVSHRATWCQDQFLVSRPQVRRRKVRAMWLVAQQRTEKVNKFYITAEDDIHSGH